MYTLFRVSRSVTRKRRPIPVLKHLLLGCVFVLSVVGCTDPSSAPDEEARDFFFYVTADPQINVPKWGLSGLEEMVGIMDEVAGKRWPFGGIVDDPRGVLIPGDLVDDTDNPKNWEVYTKYFDPEGDAKLRYPVFAGVGNHDLQEDNQPFSVVERAFIRRNKRRPGALHLDRNGYNYSWDWQNVHFVNLNLFPGNEARPVYGNPSPWNNPHESLAFLESDLARHVGDSGRPIVLMWHYGLRGWGLEKWWTNEDLANLEAALEGYNVVLILHGHEHRYERYEWAGYDVVMAPAPYSPAEEDEPEAVSTPKGFLVLRMTADSLQLAHRGAMGWKETWAKPLKAKTAPGDERTAEDSVVVR